MKLPKCRSDFPNGCSTKYYQMSFFCGNCEKVSYRYILKGVKIKDVKVKCDKCENLIKTA